MAAQREMASSEQVFTIGGNEEVIDLDFVDQEEEEIIVSSEEL